MKGLVRGFDYYVRFANVCDFSYYLLIVYHNHYLKTENQTIFEITNLINCEFKNKLEANVAKHCAIITKKFILLYA